MFFSPNRILHCLIFPVPRSRNCTCTHQNAYMCCCLAVYAPCVSVQIYMRAAWMRSRPERRAAASHASALGVTPCRSFVESLPLSPRRAPLPPCLQICFIRCNKASTQSLWCLCCFAAPLHCSPTVNACCCVSEYLQPSDMYWFHFSCRRWCACSTKDIHVMWSFVLFCLRWLVTVCCCFLGDCSHYEIAQLPPLICLYCFHCITNQSSSG